MGAIEQKKLEMIAYEAFIRRASTINSPFMLKGSYVTRQYFNNPSHRIPADLDWVYMHKITNHLIANELFSDWATKISELDLDDGVRFRSFRENDFWRMIDYAMADDFPTVNTDLKCWIDEVEIDLYVDISFNLNLEQPAIPLEYKPILGDVFVVPYTVPLSLQVSWKIHQTLVRPRFKDLFDLIQLVNHPAFDEQELARSFQALLNECKTDNLDLSKVRCFLSYDIAYLFPDDTLEDTWEYWRHKRRDESKRNYFIPYDDASEITDASRVEYDLPTFLNHFRHSMEKKGWTLDLIKDMDIPPVKKQQPVKETVEIPEHIVESDSGTRLADNQYADNIVVKHAKFQEESDLLDDEPSKSNSFLERIKKMFRKG